MRSATCIYFELSWDLRTRLLCVMNRVDVCKLAIDKRFLKLTFQTLALRQSALMKSYCRNVIFRISCFPLLQYHSFLRNLLPTYFLMLIFFYNWQNVSEWQNVSFIYFHLFLHRIFFDFHACHAPNMHTKSPNVPRPVGNITRIPVQVNPPRFSDPSDIAATLRNRPSNLRVMHLNTQSMVSTFNEFLLTVTNHTLDIITLSETWLKDNPLLMEYVAIPGFNTEFRSRDTIRGGGVGAYIKDTIKYKRRHDIENLLPELEHLWIEVPGRNRHSKALVGVIYRSRRVLDASWFESFETLLAHLTVTWEGMLIITGDTNFDLLKPEDNLVKRYSGILDVFDLQQVIEQPTRRLVCLHQCARPPF